MDYGETRDLSRAAYAYIRRLKAKGWKEIGSGLYSVVFTHPDFPYLVRKVSVNDYDPWQKYADWAKNENDAHLPKIFHFEKRKSYAIADIEKLDNYNSEKEVHRKFYNFVSDTFHQYKYVQEQPPQSIKKSIETIRKAMKPHKLQLDIHEGNVMFRKDSTVVITDPYG